MHNTIEYENIYFGDLSAWAQPHHGGKLYSNPA